MQSRSSNNEVAVATKDALSSSKSRYALTSQKKNPQKCGSVNGKWMGKTKKKEIGKIYKTPFAAAIASSKKKKVNVKRLKNNGKILLAGTELRADEMADQIAKLPKPPMRRLLHAQIKRNLVLTGITCTLAGLYMRFIFGDGRKTAYAEFYKNYDIEKEFHRIRRKGLFDSCDASD